MADDGVAGGASPAGSATSPASTDPARIADLARVRDDFAGPWVAWNVVRTLAMTASFCCLARALVVHARGRGR